MTALEALAKVAPAAPNADAAVACLRAGTILVALRVDDVAQRAAMLESVIEQMMDGETKLAWVGNPLRSPLTIERVFLQAVGADADLRIERSPADLARMLAKSAGDASRLLVILQQPETLDAEARDAIGALAEVLPAVQPPVQILFSGTQSFSIPVAPPAALVAPPRMVEPAEPPATIRREAVPILLLLALLALGALLYPTLTTPSPAAPKPQASTQAAPARLDVAVLRREFDEFLAQRAPTTPPMSEAQKEALFQEFLSRHRPPQPSSQSSSSASASM